MISLSIFLHPVLLIHAVYYSQLVLMCRCDHVVIIAKAVAVQVDSQPAAIINTQGQGLGAGFLDLDLACPPDAEGATDLLREI